MMQADLMLDRARDFFLTLQAQITDALAAIDGKTFHQDQWEYQPKGGGRSRVLQEGNVLEKAGVNFSDVSGEFTEEMAASMPGEGRAFRATGVSLVLHPWNPMLPTVHANFRCLRKGEYVWFGGGADLTPYYPIRDDVIHFHRTWKEVCERHSVADYPRFKKWCDDYFFIKHRQEPRGVGGIFFDYLHADDEAGQEALFAFVRETASHFLPAYLPILERRLNEPHGTRERDFQLVRRGRYVEFNLVYDRGTVFGLKTAGRIESILMSLPLNVKWVYDHKVEAGSHEAELFEYLKPRDWANEAGV